MASAVHSARPRASNVSGSMHTGHRFLTESTLSSATTTCMGNHAMLRTELQGN